MSKIVDMKIKKLFKKLSLNKAIDFLIINTALFILIFTWVRFVTRSLFFSLFTSLVFLLAFNIVKIFIMRKNIANRQSSKEIKDEMDRKVYSLIYLPKNELDDLFSKIYLATNNSKNDIYNVFIKNNDEKIGISYYFEKEVLDKEFCLKLIYKAIKLNLKVIIICCYSCNEKDYHLFKNIQNIKVKIYQKEDTYKELFESKNIDLGKEIIFSTSKKKQLKEYLKSAINREKSKKYFFSGLLIFFASLFVRYNFYYIIMSSLLFLLAILSRNKKYSQEEIV